MSEPEPTTTEAGIPHRTVRDPRALRAMAHPVRLRIMEELARAGQATATELSEWIGESAANCSWHLRQLAQYGFIEEAGGGTGRQRPWKVIAQTSTIARPQEGETELAHASDAFTEVILERELAAYWRWQATRRKAPEAWQDASFMTQSWNWLTVEELAAFQADFHALIERHLIRDRGNRVDPANRPSGARMARIVAWAIPD
ncbi:MAG: winged helix-turn-helix domain-containing protein [Natronosporangium sp.]